MKRGAVLVAGLAALLIASATPAAVPARTTRDFLNAPLGPASALQSMPLELTARARRITELSFKGRNHVLLVAPAAGGGYCDSLSGPYGGASCVSSPSNHIQPGLVGDQSGPILFHGSFANSDATRLEVTYQDGTTSQIPFVWVGRPIRAGFFVFQVTNSHRRLGARPKTLSLFDASGHLVGQARLKTATPHY
jgi:hypothetical protein